MFNRGLLIVAMLVAGVSLCSASPIFINNASFDSDLLALQGFTVNTISNWVVTPAASRTEGVFAPSALQYNGSGLGTSLPTCCVNGANVAYSYGGTISQVLGTVLSAGTKYTLSVDVGYRADAAPAVVTPYSIGLFAGGVQLALLSPAGSPAKGSDLTETLVFTSTGLESQIGQNLEVRLITTPNTPGETGQVNFDNVRLDAVPEPASALLLLVGMGGLYLARRRSTT